MGFSINFVSFVQLWLQIRNGFSMYAQTTLLFWYQIFTRMTFLIEYCLVTSGLELVEHLAPVGRRLNRIHCILSFACRIYQILSWKDQSHVKRTSCWRSCWSRSHRSLLGSRLLAHLSQWVWKHQLCCSQGPHSPVFTYELQVHPQDRQRTAKIGRCQCLKTHLLFAWSHQTFGARSWLLF